MLLVGNTILVSSHKNTSLQLTAECSEKSQPRREAAAVELVRYLAYILGGGNCAEHIRGEFGVLNRELRKGLPTTNRIDI